MKGDSVTIADAIGQELDIGDHVAYICRRGSSNEIQRRIITSVGLRKTPYYDMRDYEPFIRLDGDHKRDVMPHNVVKVQKLNTK